MKRLRRIIWQSGMTSTQDANVAKTENESCVYNGTAYCTMRKYLHGNLKRTHAVQ